MKFNKLGNTGVLVSELCLGAMTFGGKGIWEAIGKLGQEEVNGLVKQAIDSGINFIDTANAYSEGLSQQIILATKVRLRMGAGANQVGLSRLHILDSVNDSLRRLDTSHIDLLYIHGVDPITPLEETMRGLEDVVRMGKVRYIGISNHPAWKVVKANGIAERMNWTKFVATQNYYSAAGRDIEREIAPMAQSEGISIMPWSPLAGGFLSGKYTRKSLKAGNSRRDEFDFPPVNKEKAFDIIDVMKEIADKHNSTVARIALAWMLQKPGITSIIIGAKRIDQLNDNISATTLKLSAEEMQLIDKVSELASEYPGWMVNRQMAGRWPE
jgi:aryl-alcohol dehydrogenase-like predicted oxidoreductase